MYKKKKSNISTSMAGKDGSSSESQLFEDSRIDSSPNSSLLSPSDAKIKGAAS